MCICAIYTVTALPPPHTLSYHIPTLKFKTRHIEFYVPHAYTQCFRWKKGSCLAMPCHALPCFASPCPVPCCFTPGCYELSCRWDWKCASSVSIHCPALYRAICIHAHTNTGKGTHSAVTLIFMLRRESGVELYHRWVPERIVCPLYCNKAAKTCISTYTHIYTYTLIRNTNTCVFAFMFDIFMFALFFNAKAGVAALKCCNKKNS